MQKLVPSLWFDFNAEEALEFYFSVFTDGKINHISYYPKNSPGPEGKVMTIDFTLLGMEFIAINGGPQFPFTNAISFLVDCKDQAEIDRLWDALLDGGKPQECGWLTDKFGLSWQIAPRRIDDMIRDKNPAKAYAAMQAMLKMVKIDIAAMEAAYNAA